MMLKVNKKMCEMAQNEKEHETKTVSLAICWYYNIFSITTE